MVGLQLGKDAVIGTNSLSVETLEPNQEQDKIVPIYRNGTILGHAHCWLS